MDLKLKIYGCLCSTEVFTINGIDADYDDFGEKYDHDTENAEDWGCGNMQFDGKDSTPEILAKYSINQSEYDEVVSELSEKLSFGSCGWCV